MSVPDKDVRVGLDGDKLLLVNLINVCLQLLSVVLVFGIA